MILKQIMTKVRLSRQVFAVKESVVILINIFSRLPNLNSFKFSFRVAKVWPKILQEFLILLGMPILGFKRYLTLFHAEWQRRLRSKVGLHHCVWHWTALRCLTVLCPYWLVLECPIFDSTAVPRFWCYQCCPTWDMILKVHSDLRKSHAFMQ